MRSVLGWAEYGWLCLDTDWMGCDGWDMMRCDECWMGGPGQADRQTGRYSEGKEKRGARRGRRVEGGDREGFPFFFSQVGKAAWKCI